MMKLSGKFFLCLCAVALLLARQAPAQNPSLPDAKPPAKPRKADVPSRITIEVSGGEKDSPVENASVYVKYIEERTLRKDKKLELNVKTNRDGIAHVPDAPLGRVLIQVVAEGWHSYGRWFDITDPKQTIKVHLERPPKWYWFTSRPKQVPFEINRALHRNSAKRRRALKRDKLAAGKRRISTYLSTLVLKT